MNNQHKDTTEWDWDGYYIRPFDFEGELEDQFEREKILFEMESIPEEEWDEEEEEEFIEEEEDDEDWDEDWDEDDDDEDYN